MATGSILDFLTLERIEENLFRGQSADVGTPQVFGGQVLAQALHAAQHTVDAAEIHSVHGSFLRKGDFNAPIVYEVDRSRDGRSFASRRIVAIQHGRPIFTLAASFHIREEGWDHSPSISLPPLPSNDESSADPFDEINAESSPLRRSDFQVVLLDVEQQTVAESLQWWIRMRKPLTDNQQIHRAMLAYISDYGLLGAALLPHFERKTGSALHLPNLQYATIDHAVWFHRPCKVDDWLLYSCEPVSTSGARGTARGSFFDRNGLLVASTVQEGLVRPLRS